MKQLKKFHDLRLTIFIQTISIILIYHGKTWALEQRKIFKDDIDIQLQVTKIKYIILVDVLCLIINEM